MQHRTYLLERLEDRCMLAREDGYFAAAGEVLEIAAREGVLSNDRSSFDPELSAILSTSPRFGLLDLASDGSFRYRANNGFSGADSFEYRTDDGQMLSTPIRVDLQVISSPVIIHEIVASNANGLRTQTRPSADLPFSGDAFTPDWIELRNLASRPIHLGGFSLTDNLADTGRWRFPSDTLLPANGYLVVFASGRNVTNVELDKFHFYHTNFELSSDGEYLGLYDAEGGLVQEIAPQFPPQRSDVSYGISGTGYQYLTPPSPAETNIRSTAYRDIAADVTATPGHGFYQQPIVVSLATREVGADIRYTLDGSTPTSTNGQRYLEPLKIDKTTTLRTVVIREGFLPSRVLTQTYIFLADVLRQSPDGSPPEGWPKRVAAQILDYGMSPRIVDSPQWGPQLLDALTQIPSISLVTDLVNLFDAKTGIYVNANRDGVAWERPASVELIQPDGISGFQIGAGLRIRGGFSRSSANPKHSFRLYFNSEYGDSELNFPLFGSEGADAFQQIDLRTAQNNAWQFGLNSNSFLRDEFSRDTQRDMGQPYKRGRYYHLYLNGQYWGIYQTDERSEADYAASYFGGRDEDYDVIKAVNGAAYATDGSLAEWETLWEIANRGFTSPAAYYAVQGKNPDGTDNPGLARHVDVDNLIDYMLVIFYTGNTDGPATLIGVNNFYAIRNRNGHDAWRFFAHDSEHTMQTLATDNTRDTAIGALKTEFNPRWLHQKLMANADYRIRFADRVHQHFFGEGVFTPPRVDARLRERSGQIDQAIIAESARWGDFTRWNYTKTEWLKDLDFLLKTYVPQRTDLVLQQLISKNFYPTVAVPAFSPAAGQIEANTPIQLSVASGKIFYTLDGSDPRAIGGGIASTANPYQPGQTIALARDTVVKARAMEGNQWGPLVEANYLVGVGVSAESLRVSELHYHPGPLSAAELAAGITDPENLEFIELVNPTDQPMNLAGVRLVGSVQQGEAGGVEFDFVKATVQRIGPGERVVLVRDLRSFRNRYGAQAIVAGEWTGKLSNRSDRIELLFKGRPLQSFAYLDRWYPTTDGIGASLEFVDSYFANLDSWSTAESWRPSIQDGGTPGRASVIPGDVNGDQVFDSQDLVAVFLAGQYEDGIAENSVFQTGDWNGDRDFTTRDFVLAFQYGLFRG